ncbi:MAG: hypothetical protein ACRDZR_10795, partial [Acidimicrobiales bacterium]
AAPDPPAPTTPATPAAEQATTGAPDRDLLVEAWGDHVLRGLPARAKALFSAGRFVAVEDGAAVFALPNAAHRDKCSEVRPVVEDALAAHFGVPVRLRLEVEGGPPARGPAPAGPTVHDERGGDEDEDVQFDQPRSGEADADGGQEAEARLLQAFPGAEEVTG